MSQFNIIFMITVLLATLCGISFGGRIKFVDFQSDYSNIGLARKFFFTFQLQTTLPVTGYMQIALPFQQSNPVVAQYYEADPQTCNSFTFPLPIKTAQIQGEAATTSTYWINYPEELSNTKDYTLILTLQAAVDATIFSNAAIQFRPVQIGTFASINIASVKNLLVYDFNPVFTMIRFENAQAKSLVASVLSGNNGNLKSSQVLQVRFTPSRLQIRRVVIALPNVQGIQFDNTILTTFCTVNGLILNQDYSCLQTYPNSVLLTFNADLLAQNYDVSLAINFPYFQDSSIIQIIGLRQGDNTVVEWNEIATMVQTIIPQWTARRIFGFEKKQLVGSATAQNNIVCVYRNSVSGQVIYNTLRFVFQVSGDMLGGENYRLTLSLGVGSTILSNSIVTSGLQDYSLTQKVVCQAINNASCINCVQCINVQQLLASTDYSIQLRFTILNDNTANQNTFPSAFGQLNVYPQQADGTYYNLPSVSQESLPTLTNLTKDICLKNNNNFLNQNTPANIFDYQLAHTRPIGTSVDNLVTATDGFGVKLADDQMITFYLEFQMADFGGAMTAYSTVQILTNNLIFQPKAPADCKLPTAQSGLTIRTCTMQAESTQLYPTNPTPLPPDTDKLVSFVFGLNSIADNQSFFTPGASPQRSQITFEHIDIKFLSTVRPSVDYTVDYLVGTIPDYNASPSTYAATSIINGYVVPLNLYSDININLINFWTGTSEGNDATQLPTFIRINVFFSTNQPAVANAKWIVFFDNLNFLQDASDSTKPSCSITQPSSVCGFEVGDSASYHFIFQNYLTFTSSLAASMNIIDKSFTMIFPVSTVVNKGIIRIRTALLDSNGVLQGYSKQFVFQQPAANTDTTLISYNKQENVQFTGLNLLFNFQNYLVGQTSVNTQINVVAADILQQFVPNSNTLQGAGVTLTSIHNIVSDPNFDVTSGQGGLIGILPYQKCIKFGYQVVSTGRYGFYCPLIASIGRDVNKSFLNLINISLPWQTGTRIPDIVGAFSNNQALAVGGYDQIGYLYKFSVDSSLNAMNPNLLTNVQTDIDLPISQRFTKVSITFTTTNRIPARFNFVATNSLGSSQPFFFTVNELVICSLFQLNAGTFMIIEINGSAELPAGTYQIRVGGINIVDNPLMKQEVYFETQNSEGNTIDKTSLAYPIYYNFRPKQMSFTITNQSFLIPNKYAMSVYTFTFTLKGRSIYNDEFILFNLDAFSVDNNISMPVCKISSPQQSVSNLWKECYFDPTFQFKQLRITPLNDISITNASGNLENTFIIEIQNIRVPRTPVEDYFINGGIYNVNDDSSPIIFQEDIQLPDRADEYTMSQYTQLVLYKKRFNTQGSLSEFQFSIKPSVSNLDFNSMIMVYLPSYYSSQADFAEPVCYIQLIDPNAVNPQRTFTRCEYLDDRIIAVRDIFPTLLVGFAYSLTISGIPQPQISSALSIFVALIQRYDNISGSVLEYLEVMDQQPGTPSTDIIKISNFSKNSNTWIESDNYVFTILFTTAVPAQSSLIIDFPSDWVDKNQNKQAIVCFLQLKSAAANISFACKQQGYRIIGVLNNSLVANQDYTLNVNLFSNPHNSQCIGQGVIFQIADSQLNTILFRSYLTITNIGNLIFDTGMTSSLIFKWQLIQNSNVQDGEITLLPIPSLLRIYRGTYSSRLRLSIANGNRVYTDCQLGLAQTLSGQTPFQTNPTIINLFVGDYYVDLRIGALRSVTPGIYSIYFQFTNGGNYNIPPLLKVEIVSDPYTVPNPSVNNIVVPILGYSLPIYWNMETAVPINSLKIETDIAIEPDLDLDYQAYSDMNFQIGRASDFIILKSDDDPFADAKVSEVNLYINSLDSSYLVLQEDTVQISLVDRIVGTPSLNVVINNIQSTTITFDISSNQLILVYYQIQLKKSTLPFDFKVLREKVRVLTQYQFDDINQVQYGMFPLYAVNTISMLTISNLFSQREYIIQFFPLNQMEQLGTTFIIQSLIPKSNTDSLIKTRVFTKSILTSAHMNYLACLHSLKFLYPYKRVRSIYEDYCIPQVTAASLPKTETADTSQVYFFYLYPFEYIEVVEQLGTVYESAKLKNLVITEYQQYFATQFAALGLTLDDYQYGGRVSILPPEFTSSGVPSATKNTLLVTGITLKYPGIIFAILEQLKISIKGRVQYVQNPTFDQVRSGLNSTGLEAIDKAHAVYEGQAITFSFKNLIPSTHYRLVMYATSEDPSQYKMITVNVTSVEKTLPASSQIITTYTLLFSFIIYSLFGI